MAKETRFGPQPAREVLRQGKHSIALVAGIMGVPESHLLPALYGRIRPNITVREKLPKIVGRPLEELFTAEALSAPPGRRNPEAEDAGRFGPRGPYQRNRHVVVRLMREVSGAWAAEETLLRRALIRGEMYSADDGWWMVWDAWVADGQLYAKLRRVGDLRTEEWPTGSWPAG